MQSSQEYIPRTHRQQSDGTHLPPATAAFSNHDLQFVYTDQVGAEQSLPFDDDFWEIFELDDLDGGASIPPHGPAPLKAPDLIPPPIIRDHTHVAPNSLLDDPWACKSVFQTQSAWDLDSNPTATPGLPMVNGEFLSNPRVPHKSPLLFGEIWPGRAIQNQQSFNSSGSPYTGTSTFFDRESLRLSRIPSLATNPSSGTLSWESPPEVPAIYGASQWSGIASYPATNGNEQLVSVDATIPSQADHEERSSGLESLCGASPITAVEGSDAQAPSWFDYGNQVTQPQGISHFVEQGPLLPENAGVFHIDATNLNAEIQLFDTGSETPFHGYGNTIDHDPVQSASASLSPHSNSLMQYTPRSRLIPLGSTDLSPSSGSIEQNISNLQSVTLDHWSTTHINYGEKFDGNVSQTPVPYMYPQPQECYSNEGQAEDEDMQETDGTWNCFVIEDGSGRAITPPLHRRKGVRHGHLPPAKAKITAQRRKEGKTCIRCKIARMECDGRDPCGRCKKLGQPATLASPCIKANFLDIVKSGTCNYISQRNINHFTLDESRRVKIVLPETFDLNGLLNSLASRKQQFNIRTRSASGSLYVLDLAKCYDFLNKIRGTSSSTDGGLRSFIDKTLVKTESWHKCVKECDPSKNKTLLLSQWNNMPSRASYDLVPLGKDSSARSLDPEDEDDRRHIMIAAQLSRIVCRKLEIDGYRALQAEINNMRIHNTTYESRKDTVLQLGKILLSLRWRMSWWKLLGDGSDSGDIFRDRFVERVEVLTKVLYFYYFGLRGRIGPWVETGGLEGEVSNYPDANPVFDDFPTVQSIMGFEEWLKRGESLIREANVERRFSV